MREIKFRAWDKYAKDYIDWEELVNHFKEFSDMFVLQQYTGLKDKNGVEIYEGDVVHIVKDRYGKGQHEVWTVEYGCFGDPHILYVYNQVNSCRTVSYDIDELNYIDEDNVMQPIPHFTKTGEDKSEMNVIGNIYKNKELLNE